jgi:hypothetical protein
MAVEEHRRSALRRAAVESWGEEVADTLMDSIAPSGHELATRQDIAAILAAMDAMDERWDEHITALEQRLDERFTVMGERLETMDQRWNERLGAMDQRWNERLGAMDQRSNERLGAMDVRLVEMDKRWQVEGRELREELLGAFERRLNDAITKQTRLLTISLMVTLVTIAGLAFGLN